MVNLYTFVDLYVRVLDSLAHILTKGADHALAVGVGESDMLDWRLIDDMRPLRFQAMVICNFSRQWPARVAGLPLGADIGDDLGLEGFLAAIAEAKAFLKSLTPEQFAGRDDVALTVAIGELEPTLPAEQWLTVFATTNLYFHLSIAYAILRAKGVVIGKRDLFAGGL